MSVYRTIGPLVLILWVDVGIVVMRTSVINTMYKNKITRYDTVRPITNIVAIIVYQNHSLTSM